MVTSAKNVPTRNWFYQAIICLICCWPARAQM